MAVQILKMQFRQGNKADLLIENLIPGEPVIALDTNEVGIKTSAGAMLWFAMASGTTTNQAILATEKDVKGGIPTLDPDTGKVNEDPVSYGKPNGGATLGADGLVKLAQLVSSANLISGGYSSGSGGVPATVHRIGNICMLEGYITGNVAAGGTIMTIPAGYRPPNTVISFVTVPGTTTPFRIDIKPDGTLYSYSAWSSWMTLTGISFTCVTT